MSRENRQWERAMGIGKKAMSDQKPKKGGKVHKVTHPTLALNPPHNFLQPYINHQDLFIVLFVKIFTTLFYSQLLMKP